MRGSILLFAALISTMLISCTTAPTGPSPIVVVGCSAETSIASGFASAIQTALQCANLSQIQADLLNVLGKGNLCTQTAPQSASVQAKNKGKLKGIVGNLVCPDVVDSAMGLVAVKIPPAWGCQPSATGNAGSLQQVFTSVCEQWVPY